ncbi:MAG: putative toxin-antitoxin system toxin component, PIN family [Ginsengibacter sp.]
MFDTNTLLSALFDETSLPATALKKARLQDVLLISESVKAEYRQVFSLTKFDKYISVSTRIEFIENIVAHSFPVNITEEVSECRDPHDDKWLSLAVSARADCIITGDKDLLVLHPFRKIPILNPANFIKNFYAA